MGISKVLRLTATRTIILIQNLHLFVRFRLYSTEDIAAMKLSAIDDNGTRLKDFIGITCFSMKLLLKTQFSHA